MREDAGVFDVSHMGELEVEGPRAKELLQSVFSNDLDRIGPGHAQYSQRREIAHDRSAFGKGELLCRRAKSAYRFGVKNGAAACEEIGPGAH